MTTVLRDVDGRIAIIPNSQIINGKVVNYTKAGFVAVTVPLWIAPVSDLELIRKIVLEEADIHPRILPTVTEEEKKAVIKLFERPSIRAFFGSSHDLSMLNPQVKCGRHPGQPGPDRHPRLDTRRSTSAMRSSRNS